MISFIEKYPKSSIFLICLICLIPNLDTLVVTIMEARNFISAREMLTDSNWILTTMNGEPRYQKPPLPTWLTAISAALFGIKSVLAYRLPVILMVPFSGIFTYKITKFITKNNLLSIVSAFVLITSFYIVGITNEAPWDLFTHGFMLAGLFYLISYFRNNGNPVTNIFFSSILIGFSILSKGPVSLYVMFLPFLIAYFIVLKPTKFKSKVVPFVAVIIAALIIGGWWFFYVRMADPETFLAITERETSNWGSYNVRPFYYYWSFFTQSGIWTILALGSLFFGFIKKYASDRKWYRFAFIWTIAALILLSVIPEKKSRYLVPVLFPLSLTIGVYIENIILHFNQFKKHQKLPVRAHFILMIVVSFAIPILLFVAFREVFDGLWLWFILLSISCFTIGWYLLSQFRLSNFKNAFFANAILMLSLLLFATPFTKATFTNKNFKNIAELSSTIEPSLEILSYSYKNLTPEMIWLYGKKMPVLNSVEEIELVNDERFGIFISENDTDILTQISKDYLVELHTIFDMNYTSKVRNRLIENYYLVTKKRTFE